MALIFNDVTIPTNQDDAVARKNSKETLLDVIRLTLGGKTVEVWKKQKYYYISFNSNGGSGTMDDQTIMVGVATPLSSNLFTKLGYLFSAWSKSAGGSKAYSDGEKVTDAASAGETLVLYAIWTAITWYVKFNANGGSGTMANQAHTYDTEKALTANAFTRAGYTHKGWGTSSTGAVVYTNGQKVKNLKSTHGGTLNLYAVWESNAYYAIQDGKLVNCPNATAWSDGYSNEHGEITVDQGAIYGATGHNNGSNQSWGADTGSLDTKGCKYITIIMLPRSHGNNYGAFGFKLYGDGSEVKSETIASTNDTYDSTGTYFVTKKYDISGYDTVRAHIDYTSGDGDDCWVNAGFRSVQIHN